MMTNSNGWNYHSKTPVPKGWTTEYSNREIYFFQKEHPVHGKMVINVLSTDLEGALRIIKDVTNEDRD